MKQLKMWMLAAILICGTAAMFISCAANEDNATPTPTPAPEPTTDIPAQLKQGVWTEFDTILVATGKATMEELANMPTVGMNVEGDKAYFFTYTAEDVSEPVEGQISYDKTTGTGTITFPAIADNPLSGQTVSFTATSDEMLEFELSYEGAKTTATFAWLCENLDNWSSDIDDPEWKELMAFYETIDKNAGPDPTIDWGDLDEPLEWNDDVASNARTRADPTVVVECVSAGVELIASIFIPDPAEEAIAKLDVLTEKVDKVLANQQKMMSKLDSINDRLNEIATMLNRQETVGILNTRNEKYYNPLNTNDYYYKEAYKLYNANKSDLSKVSADLAEYAKEWVGPNEENIKLTWEYMQYLTTVQHSKYGKGMDKIYDGMTYDKYPWEHLGTSDRTSYRGYDMLMITKSLFMISLYSTYCGISNAKKGMLYDNYFNYKPKLLEFCKFNVTNPDKYRVCQIPGAHFVMRKELQKYNYYGKDGKSPFSGVTPTWLANREIAYRPEWHEAGTPKIDNPKEVMAKLIRNSEAKIIQEYYKSLYKQEKIWWTKMLVDGDQSAGAVYSMDPSGVKDNKLCLLLYYQERGHQTGMSLDFANVRIEVVMTDQTQWIWAGIINSSFGSRWAPYNFNQEYYTAIVEKRY